MNKFRKYKKKKFIKIPSCEHLGDVEIFGLIPLRYHNINKIDLQKMIDREDIGGWVMLSNEFLGYVYQSLDFKNIELLYTPIQDYGVPSNHRMDEIISFIKRIRNKGKKVIVTCWGGHGRTGLVLSIWAGLHGIENPVEYVRTHYCKRAVETPTQIKFIFSYLNKEIPKSLRKEANMSDDLTAIYHAYVDYKEWVRGGR